MPTRRTQTHKVMIIRAFLAVSVLFTSGIG